MQERHGRFEISGNKIIMIIDLGGLKTESQHPSLLILIKNALETSWFSKTLNFQR